jgi:hypothetical protein
VVGPPLGSGTQLQRIHAEGKLNMKEISKLVGVSYSLVRKIIHREKWQHVEGVADK